MTVLSDRYELGELLGSGGMARVVAAYDRVLQRDVAVKLIHDAFAFDPSSRERMLREARAAAGLHHPHTVAVFDVGEADGRAYIVMELVGGDTLADRLRERGTIPPDAATAIADAVLDGLQAAHGRGLVHRDVKPSNILLSVSGGVKLVDFGIAKALTDSSRGLTRTGQLLGTPRYLAPEQVAGQPATPASDLYAVGVVLHECLTGEVPFKADTPIAEALAHQREPVPDLSQTAAQVPPALARVVERALAKDPRDRFADAAAMRTALHAPSSPPPRPPGAPALRLATAATAVAPSATGNGTPAPTSGAPRHTQHTRVLPVAAPSTGPASTPPRRFRPRPWMLAVVAGLATAIVVIALLIGNGDGTTGQGDPDERAASAGGDAGAEAAEDPAVEDDPDTEDLDDPADHDNESDALEWPTDLDGLIAALDADWDGAGEKGRDLAKDLSSKVRDEHRDRKRAEESRELIVKTATWLADGELAAGPGEAAVVVLAGEARSGDERLVPVEDLFAEVAVAKHAWGEKADSLISELDDVLKADGRRKQAREAADLRDELEEWIEDGEIDRDRGERARQILRSLTRR